MIGTRQWRREIRWTWFGIMVCSIVFATSIGLARAGALEGADATLKAAGAVPINNGLLIIAGAAVAGVVGLAYLNLKFNNENLSRVAELKARADVRDAQMLDVLKQLNENLVWCAHHSGRAAAQENAKTGAGR